MRCLTKIHKENLITLNFFSAYLAYLKPNHCRPVRYLLASIQRLICKILQSSLTQMWQYPAPLIILPGWNFTCAVFLARISRALCSIGDILAR